jgi:hypothetical protein
MLKRRDFVMGTLAASALMHARLSHAIAVQQVSKVNFAVPAGACDCHTLIHGDPAKFPWFAGRISS